MSVTWCHCSAGPLALPGVAFGISTGGKLAVNGCGSAISGACLARERGRSFGVIRFSRLFAQASLRPGGRFASREGGCPLSLGAIRVGIAWRDVGRRSHCASATHAFHGRWLQDRFALGHVASARPALSRHGRCFSCLGLCLFLVNCVVALPFGDRGVWCDDGSIGGGVSRFTPEHRPLRRAGLHRSHLHGLASTAMPPSYGFRG